MATSPSPRRRQGQRPSAKDVAALKAAFLEDFRERGIVARSAKALGVERRLIYYWREHDAEFATAYDEALADANDAIRAEIWRRAVDGFDEEMVQGGRKFTVRKYSDTMLRLLAQSRMTEFRDKFDVTTKDQSIGYPYERILDDPHASELACQLAEHLAPASVNAGGLGESGE